jgi:phenolic acid decarboxylase
MRKMSETTPIEPDFQLVINPQTGRKTGRIYFPKSYVSQNLETLKNWLRQDKIYLIQSHTKMYKDGSFRLLFEAPEQEYRILSRFTTKRN